METVSLHNNWTGIHLHMADHSKKMSLHTIIMEVSCLIKMEKKKTDNLFKIKWQNHWSKYNSGLKYVPCSDFLKYKLFHFWCQWNLEKLNLTVLSLQWFYSSTTFSPKEFHICTTGLRNPTVKLYGLLDANITRTAMSTELNQSAWSSLWYSVLFIVSLSTTALSCKNLPQPGHAIDNLPCAGAY